MDKNLIWKIVLIAAVIVIAALNLYPPSKTLKAGIDIAGGTQLIYEIDTTGLEPAEQKNLAQNMIPILLKRIDPTHVANVVMRPQGDTRIEILLPVASQDTITKRQAFEDALETLEAENINLLKIRRALSQPAAQRSETLATYARGSEERQQVLDGLVEIYDLRTAAQDQRNTLDAEMAAVQEKLETAGVDFDHLSYSLTTWGKESDLTKRADAIKTYLENSLEDDAAAQAAAVPLVNEYLELMSKRSPVVDELTNIDNGLNVRWETVVSDLQKLNLNVDLVREILELPVKSPNRSEKLDAFKAAFPDRTEKLDAVVATYDAYSKVGGQLDDPEDLKRMLKGAGVLEFRILAVADETTTASQLQGYVAELAEKGPKLASKNNFKWCEIEDVENWPTGLGLVGMFGEKAYVLCKDNDADTLLQDGEKKWKLKKAYPSSDQQGRRAIGFTFDDVAANKFFRVTSDNIGKPLCILLDDKALSAPNINSPIRSSGIITGQFNQTETSDMINKLNAGSFPARLSEVPISEKSISATIGADNRDSGVEAGLIGLAAVAVFMLIYYMLSGVIANVALMLNILFVLGIMALLNATFTLPGIAGLILTIGMSVDANVLIFERIREEQNRGSSLKAAIVNGYQRAFRTIFDANLTTFGVAAILYMAASEEIKGFAIVLMLGIVSSMFTALFVTRVIYDLMTSSRIITNKLAMLGMMQNAKVNWMGMRPLFLTISAVLIFGGLAIFTSRDNTGSEGKYDIEFVGGTTVEIELKDGFGFDRQTVYDMINAEQYLNDQASVIAVGDTGLQYEISTTLTNKTTATVTPSGAAMTVEELTGLISDKADEMNKTISKLSVVAAGSGFEVSTSRVNATLVEDVLTQAVGEKAAVSDVEVHELVSEAVRNAFKDYLKVQEDLQLTFTAEEKIEPTSDDAALLADYLGGVKLTALLETATTAEELEKRITNIRFKPDMQDLTWYSYKLLKDDLAEPEEGEMLKSFIYVSVHPDAGYRELEADEWDAFINNEKDTVAGAAALETTLSRVTQIDPSIGGESKQRAMVAIVLSLLAIIGYIWVRFGTARYGFAAIAALVHDVCITLGVVTACHFIAGKPLGDLLGVGDFKINLQMIAAFLTIIGYSLNDTIVVFDRIRENRGKLDILTPEMVNTSINQTLSRTLLTSFTTFLVVLIMYIWGGAGLRGFTFAMLIGIIVGTYSSVAIAAPILLLGNKKAAKK
ncbi:MAG: protein translocase subunit SecD [Planctomycetota bacterium]|jgi:SecD/SecF fusion protein